MSPNGAGCYGPRRRVPRWSGRSRSYRSGKVTRGGRVGRVAGVPQLEVDDDLAVDVPAGLQLDRSADLPDREGCRDGHTELAGRDQAGDLLDGAGAALAPLAGVTGELRADVTAEDIAASLIGIFTVARSPGHHARASRLLNILMDGLRPAP
jgi:hypothetical protein